jgi:MFS superfamily sulfate permease-like transporter
LDGDVLAEANARTSFLKELNKAFQNPNQASLLVFSVSLGTMWLWSTRIVRKHLWLRLTPAAIVALLAGSLTNEITRPLAPSWTLPLGSDQLVNLPLIKSWGDFLQIFHTPDWSFLTRFETYRIALSLALVASIETLLSLEAGDKLDRYHRLSPKNRELLAQGFGNLCAGLVGALPVTTAIVRTTTNIFSGARTRNSTIWNGFLVFLATVGGAALLNHIPIACVSAILISIAYKLLRPEIFRIAWEKGPNQFVPLVVTTVAILLTDILIGSAIGLLAGFGMSLWTNYYSGITVIHEGRNWLIRFSKDVSFINKIRLKTALQRIPEGASVLIDGTRAMFIDLDVIEELEEFREHCAHRGISLEMKGIEGKEYPFWSIKRKLQDLA